MQGGWRTIDPSVGGFDFLDDRDIPMQNAVGSAADFDFEVARLNNPSERFFDLVAILAHAFLQQLMRFLPFCGSAQTDPSRAGAQVEIPSPQSKQTKLPGGELNGIRFCFVFHGDTSLKTLGGRPWDSVPNPA